MNFCNIEIDEQKEFLSDLTDELNNKNALKLYESLYHNFNKYCFGMKNADGKAESLLYFLPSPIPIVFPPLIIPSRVSNIEQTIRFTISFAITEIRKIANSTQIVFLIKENTKTGKIVLSMKDYNNGKVYSNNYYTVIGIIPQKLNDEKSQLLKNVRFKKWKNIGDNNVKKLLDLTFEESQDKKIANGEFIETMRNDFKNKKIHREDCIIMGDNEKAIGLAFPNIMHDKSNEDVIFGSAYYFGILPKMRKKGYSYTLFASCIDKLINIGANVYRGRVSKDNGFAIKVYKKFDFEVYDTIMSIDLNP